MMAPFREFAFDGQDFERVCRLIHRRAGIALNESKANMVYSRLARRVRTCGFTSFASYLDQLDNSAAPEWPHFIGCLTTHLTYFFRESHHFELLAERLRARCQRTVATVWSAACSTGEEPYSIAITAAEAYGVLRPPVRILASDVDTRVIQQARLGIYRSEQLSRLDASRVQRYFGAEHVDVAGSRRVRRELQALVEFRQINLLQAGWLLQERFDAVFCRNVMIYFDRQAQQRILEGIHDRLVPGGWLFVGHAENLYWARSLFEPCGRTVYAAR